MNDKHFPTLEDRAYVALFQYLFEVYYAETVDHKLAFCRAISESAKAEIKRPELLEQFGKAVRTGGMSFPGRKARYAPIKRDGVRRAGFVRRTMNTKRWGEDAG